MLHECKFNLKNVSCYVTAKIYLDPHRLKESHNRSYQNVSVMFASIPHFMDFFADGDLSKNGLKGLQILNQIITEFDKVSLPSAEKRLVNLTVRLVLD